IVGADGGLAGYWCLVRIREWFELDQLVRLDLTGASTDQNELLIEVVVVVPVVELVAPADNAVVEDAEVAEALQEVGNLGRVPEVDVRHLLDRSGRGRDLRLRGMFWIALDRRLRPELVGLGRGVRNRMVIGCVPKPIEHRRAARRRVLKAHNARQIAGSR